MQDFIKKVTYAKSRDKQVETQTESFETETDTRPETFETETRENGSQDTSPDRDQASRLHH